MRTVAEAVALEQQAITARVVAAAVLVAQAQMVERHTPQKTGATLTYRVLLKVIV